jgi:hypothetical protein
MAQSAMTDEEKHAEARRRGLPHATILYPSLYDEAERQGYDMSVCVKQKPIPLVDAGSIWLVAKEDHNAP